MTLPADIRLFPLSGALLLPRGTLPLRVFEPRYLAMVEDALGAGRFIGVIQPVDQKADPVPGDAALRAIGCVGRIVGFEESETGHFHINLLGISRFRLLDSADQPDGFRMGHVNYTGFDLDLADDPGSISDREGLEDVLRTYCDAKGMQTDWQTIEDASDEALVTSFSMLFPFDPSEKQALLECESVDSRAALLTSLLEIAVHSTDANPSVRH